MSIPASAEDAIRQALREGAKGDFCDVSEVVKKQFGFTVGSGLVEQVYHEMQSEQEPTEAGGSTEKKTSSGLKHVDLALLEKLPRSSNDETRKAGQPTNRERILEFVREKGGFAAARDAITELEESLKELMD